MGKTLIEIAKELKNSQKKVQLIYAFNGVGKTQLSRAVKELVSPKHEEEEAQDGDTDIKVLYYNAFTEDLFYWDNDLEKDTDRKLVIRPNAFTDWILQDEGQESNIITGFQHYTNDKLTPRFNEGYNEVSFSIEGGNEERIDNIKISRGEESCFIWCVFYSLLKEVVEVLNVPESEDRPTSKFDDLEYIFIDDPVSSLDENHLIELAVDIAEAIKNSNSDLKFIITTHNPLFYNVIYNELNAKAGYMLSKYEDGTFKLEKKKGDSNKSFSYHLFLKQTIEEALDSGTVQKYHFTLLRNLYEKTANFLGYPQWSDLLPDDRQIYYNRIIQFTSHSTLSNEAVAEPTEAEKKTVRFLLDHLIDNRYWKERKP
ncbi:AAA family ATPase [Akkermansia muciniphila]|uniref:AAA family ATPase n=1 Tax=Akkermansia muciniphila TaxID=239935 RepID=UPI00138E7866|nr:AAA family ATPase [Akkermansia muciniphila]QHV13705.1 anticodon nuclease [Akkermansia muciniphila]QHV16173.1 anticodon nuclease [Akkermansia muciniphila]